MERATVVHVKEYMAPEPDSIDELQEQDERDYETALKGERMSIAELMKGADPTPTQKSGTFVSNFSQQ